MVAREEERPDWETDSASRVHPDRGGRAPTCQDETCDTIVSRVFDVWRARHARRLTPNTCSNRSVVFLLLALGSFAVVACCVPGKATRPAGPAIEISTYVWDFGTIERGQRTASEIKVTNAGDDSLRVRLHTACDCLTASIGSSVISPGGSSPISLIYMGDEVKDASSKTLYIDSNDPVRGRLTVNVTGRVTEGKGPHLVALPNPLPLVPLKEAAGAGSDAAAAGLDGSIEGPVFQEAMLSVINRGGGDLVIDQVRCFGCSSDWTEKTLRPGEEAALYIDALPDWPDKRWIEIQSSDPVTPLKKVPIVEMD